MSTYRKSPSVDPPAGSTRETRGSPPCRATTSPRRSDEAGDVGVQASDVEDLVGVDVADPGDHVLVEEQRLEQRDAAAEQRRPTRRVGSSTSGSSPRRATRGPRRRRDRVEHDHLAERARIDEQQLRMSPSGVAEVQHDVGVRRARGPGIGTSSSWPVMRRWTIKHVARVERDSRYLPRRSAAVSVVPVSPSISACRDVRRTVRSRPTSTPSIDRPTTELVQPAPNGLDLRQLRQRSTSRRQRRSGVGSRPLTELSGEAAGRRGGRPLLGRPLERPRPHRARCRPHGTGGEEALLVVGTLLGDLVHRLRHAGGGEQLLQGRLEVELVEVLGGRFDAVDDQSLDEVVGRWSGRGRCRWPRSAPPSHRRGSTAWRSSGRRLALAELDVRADAELDGQLGEGAWC